MFAMPNCTTNCLSSQCAILCTYYHLFFFTLHLPISIRKIYYEIFILTLPCEQGTFWSFTFNLTWINNFAMKKRLGIEANQRLTNS